MWIPRFSTVTITDEEIEDNDLDVNDESEMTDWAEQKAQEEDCWSDPDDYGAEKYDVIEL